MQRSRTVNVELVLGAIGPSLGKNSSINQPLNMPLCPILCQDKKGSGEKFSALGKTPFVPSLPQLLASLDKMP